MELHAWHDFPRYHLEHWIGIEVGQHFRGCKKLKGLPFPQRQQPGDAIHLRTSQSDRCDRRITQTFPRMQAVCAFDLDA